MVGLLKGLERVPLGVKCGVADVQVWQRFGFIVRSSPLITDLGDLFERGKVV